LKELVIEIFSVLRSSGCWIYSTESYVLYIIEPIGSSRGLGAGAFGLVNTVSWV